MLLSHGNRNEILFYDVLNVMGRGGETGKGKNWQRWNIKNKRKKNQDLKVPIAVF